MLDKPAAMAVSKQSAPCHVMTLLRRFQAVCARVAKSLPLDYLFPLRHSTRPLCRLDPRLTKSPEVAAWANDNRNNLVSLQRAHFTDLCLACSLDDPYIDEVVLPPTVEVSYLSHTWS